MNFTIVCDGGSLGNNTKGGGEGYGSFVIWPDIMTKKFMQHFGAGVTNNEAEYRILIVALEYLKATLENSGINLKETSVDVRTDSALVCGQLGANWKVKAANLLPLVAQANNLSRAFAAVNFIPTNRENIVKVLGH